jgi:hypothetical protein
MWRATLRGTSGDKACKVQVKILAKDKGKVYGGVRSVVHKISRPLTKKFVDSHLS